MHKGVESATCFSIVIPAYNTEEFVDACLRSALGQRFDTELFEVILIDDCSTDSTFDIASQIASTANNLVVTRAPTNSGPGIARNAGVKRCTGDWIIFLDSDDRLHPDALSTLKTRIDESDGPTLDAIGFNWHHSGEGSTTRAAQHAQQLLLAPRSELIGRYLSLQTDSSVIYTAVRRGLITDNELLFSAGYHEDVDYLFKVYWLSREIGYVDRVLYTKQSRVNSIVNTITDRHLQGFMRAWKEIADFVTREAPGQWRTYAPDYESGTLSVIATRIREIARRIEDPGQAASLYAALYDHWFRLPHRGHRNEDSGFHTKYQMIALHFLNTMQDEGLSAASKAESITAYFNSVVSKSWSCVDLHHSVFLRPDEVRTCCKRFFVDGKMRGDVSLLKIATTGAAPDMEDILSAKQTLHNRINSGRESACDGCPFLAFREWGPLETLDVRYLSLEYHSVCNLKCTYCSDTYYGGKKAPYDIGHLIDSFLEHKVLDSRVDVVWGGGEPTIDKTFAPTINNIADRLPNATQRVLTNGVKYSNTVGELLAQGKVTVTTSVDAGTDDIYLVVHRGDRFRKVLETLKKYAGLNAERVTVKYIFTKANSAIEEISAFAKEVREYELTRCNFQISSDFREEAIALETAASMICLFGLLRAARCRLVFFDDLLRQRLYDIHCNSEQEIVSMISDYGLGHVLADPTSHKSVAIWGAGWQARYLLEKTLFFKNVEVAFFVDSTPSKIGGRFLDRDVLEPSVLLKTDIPVVIAAVQGFPAIYDSFVNLGIDESRLIGELII